MQVWIMDMIIVNLANVIIKKKYYRAMSLQTACAYRILLKQYEHLSHDKRITLISVLSDSDSVNTCPSCDKIKIAICNGCAFCDRYVCDGCVRYNIGVYDTNNYGGIVLDNYYNVCTSCLNDKDNICGFCDRVGWFENECFRTCFKCHTLKCIHNTNEDHLGFLYCRNCFTHIS